MAVSPTDQAFLREVDEELRRDKVAAAARRWGIVAIVAVIAGLLAFGGWLYWQHRQTQAAGVEGEQLMASYDQLQAGRPAPALSTLAQSEREGYRALALMAEADALIAKNDSKGAAAKFAAVAGDATLGQPFRDLATVRRTALEFDALPPQQVVERLRPLAVAGNPWFGSAGEMTAIAHLRQNRRDLAGRMFGQIAKADDVPESIRQRAVQMAGLLGVDAAPSAGTPTS